MPKNFYVYIYLDTTKFGKFNYGNWEFSYEPFYVGKGSNDRAFHQLRMACSGDPKNWYNPKIQHRIRHILNENTHPLILILQENIFNENDAYDLETDIINTIGIDRKLTGPLLNGGIQSGGRKNIKKNQYNKTKNYKPSILKGTKLNLTEEQRLKKKIEATGKNNANSILNEQNVIEIRQILKEIHHITFKEIADAYKVKPGTIRAIKNKKIWKHLIDAT